MNNELLCVNDAIYSLIDSQDWMKFKKQTLKVSENK